MEKLQSLHLPLIDLRCAKTPGIAKLQPWLSQRCISIDAKTLHVTWRLAGHSHSQASMKLRSLRSHQQLWLPEAFANAAFWAWPQENGWMPLDIRHSWMSTTIQVSIRASPTAEKSASQMSGHARTTGLWHTENESKDDVHLANPHFVRWKWRTCLLPISRFWPRMSQFDHLSKVHLSAMLWEPRGLVCNMFGEVRKILWTGNWEKMGNL